MSDVADINRRIELERADATKKALELVSSAIEQDSVNPLYRAAYKRALKIIRGLMTR